MIVLLFLIGICNALYRIDGREYDLTNLAKSGTDYYKYSVNDSTVFWNFRSAVNPQKIDSCSNEEQTFVALQVKNASNPTHLKNAEQCWPIAHTLPERVEVIGKHEGLHFYYHHNSGNGAFHIYLRCNKKKLSIVGSKISEDEWSVDFNTKNGCPLPIPLSFGSVALIVLSCLLALYLLVGIFIQAVLHGKRGLKMLPNWEFWSMLPGLVMDAFRFMFSPCFGKRKDYVDIDKNATPTQNVPPSTNPYDTAESAEIHSL
ncbi:uncharacterized protein MONOS_17789 [Monocercomonoides exilis]|uniref:uncharacterized protein n=1 Tax=Monocercomonoides exilis TaxID=2049356 RepID=UPI00355A6483|nr:hypothetical protein MONOS_17789 [Monocercomonoides exilis]